MINLLKGGDMEASNENVEFSFNDIKNHPEWLIRLLSEGRDVSLMIRRRANDVRVLQRVYPDEAQEIMAESKAELAKQEESCYSEDQAFQDFNVAQKKISGHLKKTKHSERA